MPASEERFWALKPCQNCEPSVEMDELIRGMISHNSQSLSFKGQMQTLVSKYTDTDKSSVDRLLETLMEIEDPKLRLQSIV